MYTWVLRVHLTLFLKVFSIRFYVLQRISNTWMIVSIWYKKTWVIREHRKSSILWVSLSLFIIFLFLLHLLPSLSLSLSLPLSFSFSLSLSLSLSFSLFLFLSRPVSLSYSNHLSPHSLISYYISYMPYYIYTYIYIYIYLYPFSLLCLSHVILHFLNLDCVV